MAVFFRGMTPRETADLTELMLHSGKTMDLSGLTGPFVDKHSTGGVGDKVSLILAPIVAACGVKVPMMSGRALGHTGGTLDKLESIPGYHTGLTGKEFRDFIKADGFAMTGQTAEIVPADKKLYALRDVTGTVESIPLITASILSKKVAEGADALVFDVKTGPGAFMKTVEDSEALARSLVSTGTAMGKRIVGRHHRHERAVGRHGRQLLRGGGKPRLSRRQRPRRSHGSHPAPLGPGCSSRVAWPKTSRKALRNAKSPSLFRGKPRELFLANVARQGGDVKKFLELRGKYRSTHSRKLGAKESGYITGIDAYKIGLAGVYIGVGRDKTTDPVFPRRWLHLQAQGRGQGRGGRCGRRSVRQRRGEPRSREGPHRIEPLHRPKPPALRGPLIVKEITAL